MAALSSAGRSVGSRRAWSALVREVRRAGGRAVISSEWFSDASIEDIHHIVDDLDPARVHVVVTVRPLARLLGSQWQQFVQGGMTVRYEDWLRTVFDEPASGAGRRFWHRHRHDALIGRWAAIAGPDRVTAVVVDDRDHTAILRTFERLVGLRPGTLELVRDRANRSLTRAEAEVVQTMNEALADAGLTGPRRLDLVLFGAAARLKLRDPGPDEGPIDTPAWALERAGVVAAEIVQGIHGSGVRVTGDLEGLLASGSRPASMLVPARGAGRDRREGVWPDIVAASSLGVLTAGGLARTGARNGDLAGFSTQRIRSILLGRVVSAVTGS